MIKLLILTPYIPYPINSGGNQGFFQLVNRLRHYANISIIFSIKKTDRYNIEILQSLWPNVKFYLYFEENESSKKGSSYLLKLSYKLKIIIDKKLRKKYIRLNSTDLVRLHSILRSDILTIDEGYIDFIDNVIHSNTFDIVQVDFFELINIVNILPDNLKKVFIHHEIRFVRARQELDLMHKQKPLDIYLFNNLKNIELQYLNSYDAVVTVTDVDNAKLKQELRDNILIATSPAIVDVGVSDWPSPFCFNNKLVFLGGSDHFPNLDGVDWFLNNCWASLRLVNPNLELHVIGQWKSKLKKKYVRKFDKIFFRGFVDDLSVVLANTIMIVPLRIGSGVRIKILDAISKGVPLVSTSVGAEGIVLENKKDCLLADNKDSFVESTLMLTESNELCDKLRFNARMQLNSREDPQQLALRRLHIYEDILNLPHTTE